MARAYLVFREKLGTDFSLTQTTQVEQGAPDGFWILPALPCLVAHCHSVPCGRGPQSPWPWPILVTQGYLEDIVRRERDMANEALEDAKDFRGGVKAVAKYQVEARAREGL